MTLQASELPDIVLVFAPYIESGGQLISPHYDLPEYRAEIDGWMRGLSLDWEWRPVTVANLAAEIDHARKVARDRSCVVFNLCDGTEADGYPGFEVVEALDRAGLSYTGADAAFYRNTTSKALSKALFVRRGVSTAPHYLIRADSSSIDAAIKAVGFPIFIKPDVSAGSYGIQVDSVCHDRADVERKIKQLMEGMHGQHFEKNGILAEAFVQGREFTVLAVEDAAAPGGLRVVPAAERVFDPRVSVDERFLAFERYWELPEENRRLPPGDPYYWYELAPAAWQDELADLSRRAIRAVDGAGYARVDIRQDEVRRVFFVLEVNAQCGLSADDSATVGSMLRQSGHTIIEIIALVLAHGIARRKSGNRKPIAASMTGA